ncbi:MAG: sulfotransferase [Myxococcota bacterium]
MDLRVLGQLVEVARERGDLTPRFVTATTLFMGLFFSAYGIMRSFQGMDRLLAPRFQDEPVKEPVFIVGNPRSGTTFLHRMMSEDQQFSNLALYQTLLPSTVAIRSVTGLARLDTAVGRPVQRMLAAAQRWIFRGWKGIHHVSLDAPEEDEMLFMYAMRTPAWVLLHPGLAELPSTRDPSQLPANERARLVADVRSAWQRQAYAVGQGRRLLVKNALAAGRMEIYREAFPDLSVVHLVRHPYHSIPSMVSMFSRTWYVLNPSWTRDPDVLRIIARLGVDYYRELDAFVSTLDPARRIELAYDELIADPEATVRRVYQTLDLPLTESYAATLQDLAEHARGYRSSHQYDLERLGLSRQWIHEALADVFERRGFDPGLA